MTKLEKLDLSHNKIIIVHEDTWQGLQSLRELDLRWNEIEVIHSNGLGGLLHLDTLYLHANELTTFMQDVFNPDDYPDSDGHPEHLTLSLSGNPFQCDNTMCWLKEGADQGWITWHDLKSRQGKTGRVHVPKFENIHTKDLPTRQSVIEH